MLRPGSIHQKSKHCLVIFYACWCEVSGLKDIVTMKAILPVRCGTFEEIYACIG